MNTSVYINPNELPPDVFTLKHDDFYLFVQRQCGQIQSDILKFQLISDADIFIECNDPTEILKYNNPKLDSLKSEACLMIDDKSFIVLAGINSSFNSLRKRLLKKVDEDMKQMKKRKNIFNTSTPLTPLTSSTNNQSKTNDELKIHMIKSIDQWIDKFQVDFNLQTKVTLVETVDYTIELKDNVNDQHSVIVSCVCGAKATLSRHANNGYFQVSKQF